MVWEAAVGNPATLAIERFVMKPPTIVSGRDGIGYFWRVGECELRVRPATMGDGWDASARCPTWDGAGLRVDGEFAAEAEAVAWCARMASVFARDLADDRDQRSF